MKWNSKKGLLVLGVLGGLLIAILAFSGNPKNMALCTACFIRDSAGAMKFHTSAVTQYFRPEIAGLMAGAFVMSLAKKEYHATTSKNVLIQFILGNILMIGALIFLGCTLRMVLRMAGGDLSAYIGLIGLILGVLTGTFFIKKGYSLGEKTAAAPINGAIWPIMILAIFILTVAFPSLFAQSETGPGSMHANRWLSLAVGLAFGAFAYYTRVCFTGSIRDAFIIKDYSRLLPILGIFLTMLVYNIIVGDFSLQAAGPIAHNQTLWNILSMYVVGFAGVLAGGCPVRQVIMAGSGSTDAGVAVLGMFSGAALAHNFALAAGPTTAESAGGPGVNGQIALIACLIILFILAFYGCYWAKKEGK